MKKELTALGKVELEPRLEGRQMIMIIGPEQSAAK
jgi:translation initiation factor IF-3